MSMKSCALAVAAATALVACGGGDGEHSGEGAPGVPSANDVASAPVDGRVATAFVEVEAFGARTESFEDGSIVRCNYSLASSRLVFEHDTANLLEGRLELRRGGEAECEGDDNRFGRIAGMAIDDVLPAEVTIRTTAVNFIETGMDAERGDVVLQAEITANGGTSVNELSCRAYPQRGEVWLSCGADEIRLDNHGLPATEGSSSERMRFSVRGQLQF